MLARLLRDDAGSSAAEYAIILAVIGAAIALAAYGLGVAISFGVTRSADCVSQKTASACS
jgi:pilus assembly protein Flp/PilA